MMSVKARQPNLTHAYIKAASHPKRMGLRMVGALLTLLVGMAAATAASI